MNYCDCTKHVPRSLSGCELGSFGTKTSNFWGFLIRKLRFVKQIMKTKLLKRKVFASTLENGS